MKIRDFSKCWSPFIYLRRTAWFKLDLRKQGLIGSAGLVYLPFHGSLRRQKQTVWETKRKRINISGIYPHLAYYNNEGECGTSVVVVWAGKLWVVTYGPHLPFGSSDKLYEIDDDLNQTIHPESIGGS